MQYEKAAKILHEENSSIVLAKIDADNEANKPLAEKYEVKGFPTLKIFRKDSGIMGYTGPREAEGIVSYVKRYAGPPSEEILTAQQADDLINENRVVVVRPKTLQAPGSLMA